MTDTTGYVEVELQLQGHGVGEWLEMYGPEFVGESSLHLVSGQPRPLVSTVAVYLDPPPRRRFTYDGYAVFALRGDGNEFANTAEAAQVGIEQLSKLPGAELFANAALQLTVRRRYR